MAGHSKWSTIRHKKAITDAKKSQIFSKLSTQITLAAKKGGGDPDMNPNLRLYLDKAKSAGFPVDRIKKAIQKGTGEGKDEVAYEEAIYEGFGPSNIQILVDVITDNKNRTIADLRRLFEEIGGRMGESGSVAWNFDTKGLIVLRSGRMKKSDRFGHEDEYVPEDRQEVMMEIMDIEGVEDINECDLDGVEGLEVYTQFSDLAKVRDGISKRGYVLEQADIIKEPRDTIQLTGSDLDKAQAGIERIEDHNDVQSVWSNLEL